MYSDGSALAQASVSGNEVIDSGRFLICSGTFVAVGMGAKMTLPVPFFQIICKQLHIVGSFRYGTGDYEFAISLVERGLVDLKPLVTQRYEFADALEAFEATKAGKGPDGKPVIKCIINAPK